MWSSSVPFLNTSTRGTSVWSKAAGTLQCGNQGKPTLYFETVNKQLNYRCQEEFIFKKPTVLETNTTVIILIISSIYFFLFVTSRMWLWMSRPPMLTRNSPCMGNPQSKPSCSLTLISTKPAVTLPAVVLLIIINHATFWPLHTNLCIQLFPVSVAKYLSCRNVVHLSFPIRIYGLQAELPLQEKPVIFFILLG